jgi:membrane protein implicated in regulation of membrane protease activity
MISPAALSHWIPLAGIAFAFLSTLSVLAVWRVASCLDARCRGATLRAGQ